MDWKRVVAFIILLAACMIFAFVVSISYISNTTGENVEVPLWWVGNQFTGTLIAFSPDEITLRDRLDNEKTFVMDKNTKIALRGTTRFSEGMLIKVIYKPLKNKLLAKTVRLLKKQEEKIEEASPEPSPADEVEATVEMEVVEDLPQVEESPAPEDEEIEIR
ncbi:MAG: hypothetical protein J7M18_05440 [Candidatus Eremiobacteraeota bacterium]|nr:hypothetical protein [Candidatus Eremiobacteraeota bacterium]